MVRLPLAHKLILSWLRLPQVQRAFTAKNINFAPACAEVIRSRLATKLLDHYSGHSLRYQLQFAYELMRLYVRHPLVTGRTLVHQFLPPSLSTSPADILVFSNGLHLASYASLILNLNQSHSVRLVTDRQSPLDSFYLSQYHLFPQSFQPTPTTLDRGLLSILDRQLASLPVFLPKECLKHVKNIFLPSFLAKYALAKSLIAQTQPKLLITTHDPGPSAMAYVLAAKAQNIPTLVLLHGIPSEGWYFFSDYQLVWGPLTKKFIVSQGIPARKLISGGQPIFYDYQQYFHTRSSYSSQPTIGIILSGYGANQPHQVAYIRNLLKLLKGIIPTPQIIIRLHPGQYLDHFAPAHLDLGRTIEEFVVDCSIIITQTSTAALIAALSNRPIIYFPALHSLMPQGILWSHKAFSATSSVSQVVSKVKLLLSRPSFSAQYLHKQHQELQTFTGPIHAQLGERLAQEIIRKFFP